MGIFCWEKHFTPRKKTGKITLPPQKNMPVAPLVFTLFVCFDCSTNMVMNYTEVESKVREATNDDTWGPHGTLMSEIARETFTYEHFPEVMGMLWKRMLQDNKKNWRRVYKVNQQILNFLGHNQINRPVSQYERPRAVALASSACVDKTTRIITEFTHKDPFLHMK